MSEQMLDIAKIKIDGDTQPRMAIDQGVVAEYAGLLESGTEFPPVQVVSDGAVHWLVDGFHRYFAHRQLGRKQIKAEVTTGLQDEAQWQSLSANKTHGLRRTNNDKSKAVIKALKMKPGMSDPMIAQHVGVHLNTVLKYRQAIAERATYTKCVSRTGRDGRTRCTENIGKASRSRRQKAGISPNALTPIRPHSQPVDTKTPINMPRDPEMGAHTLFDLFDQAYIRRLVMRLEALLEGTAGPAPVLQEIAAAARN